MSTIVKSDPACLRMKIKKMLGNGQNSGINFDDIDTGAAFGEIHRDHSHAQTDAKDILNISGVGPRQSRKHVRKGGLTLLASGVVDVLNQIIIQVEPRRTLTAVDDLKLTKMGVALEQLHGPGVMTRPFAMPGQADRERHENDRGQQNL